MKKFNRIDNIKSTNFSIWVLAKMLKYSSDELDGAELQGLAGAIMIISSDLDNYCSDLLPDEFDDENEIDEKIFNIQAVLATALEIKKEVTK